MECKGIGMRDSEKELLKRKIDEARLISFDIFDTLLFRKTNDPETIFDLIGKHFNIHGFRKLRMDEQNEASRRVYESCKYPHANIDEIYEVLTEHKEIPVDWREVKKYEIQLEKDALVANREMLEIFQYAKNQGKRVVATSDMYLFADTLLEILSENGFNGFDYVYCSADEHKAKFNKELFELVAEREKVLYEQILHIGDKERDDGEFPKSYGIKTFIYHRNGEFEKIKNIVDSDIDKGLYKILYNDRKGFWYNLGVEAGGPLYMGLYKWFSEKVGKADKKIFFLSRDGYNLYHIFREQGYQNIEYLYTSRRALTLAAICDMNERDIESLPPYTYGQTVGEILDYLCVDRDAILHLAEVGFKCFEDIIRTEQDMKSFKKLYVYDKEVFLERCRKEREAALAYFKKVGFFDDDVICFDCGWQGSSQELIERFKHAVGYNTNQLFYYFGIKNSDKSRKQLHGLHYDTFLFDFYKNYSLQADINQNAVMYELFFSSPRESVCVYNNGDPVFENGKGDKEKGEILQGIMEYVRTGLDFVEKYDIEYSLEGTIGHLKRLIHMPTEEEAIKIGNLQNVDGFARKQGEKKYVAYITKEQLQNNKYTEIYWLEGLLRRPDVSEEVKKECASRCGVQYPKENSIYHLENEQDIRNYHRWIRYQEKHLVPKTDLSYQPKFSFVIPVYNTLTEQLEECIESVLAQDYENYELILVDDHSTWENVVPVLRRYETHDKIRVIYRNTNGHISAATNDGIAVATGDFIVFMDCDDVVESNALYEIAKKLNENPALDFIYSDEDKITEDGKIRHLPFFKPDWSPDLFLTMMYTNHLAAYRTSIVREAGGLRTAYNGSQDYDFTLRFMERSDNSRVGHIAKVLYHWRERKESVAFAIESKNYAAEAARYAKEDYIRRNNLKAHLEYITGISQYRIIYEVVDNPLVSIIIPSKDHPDILRQCIDSIKEFTDYRNYEIIVVDNGSGDDNKCIIENYLSDIGAKYIYQKETFNFSKMCNAGAAQAEGQYLLFLNDDIEIFQPEWLERMLGQAQQKHAGAVGAKLFYPGTTKIQHAGVSNLKYGPDHNFMAKDDGIPYYFGWNRVDYNCIAVTGACLLIDKDKFVEVKGFDEKFPVAYNDVKLCFSLHGEGYYNVIRDDVVAYHHESLSRGNDILDDKKLIRLGKERMELLKDFPKLRGKDPYMNPNLHALSNGLDLKIYYDELSEIEIGEYETAGSATIDFVNVTDRVQIIGWSLPDGEKQIDELERYLVFEDPFGKTYISTVLPVQRPDVAAYYGEKIGQYAGFECVLRKTDLRVDILPYSIGILTVDKLGKKYLCWCKESNTIRSSKPRPLALDSKKLDKFEQHESASDIQWYVDECQRYDSYYKICGFAFKRGIEHYKYAKTLVLSDKCGNSYEFEVHLEERIDVAFNFPDEHFLYYTGFVCYVFDSVLEAGHEYDVIIRLTNQFDKDDICDIVTEKKVKM